MRCSCQNKQLGNKAEPLKVFSAAGASGVTCALLAGPSTKQSASPNDPSRFSFLFAILMVSQRSINHDTEAKVMLLVRCPTDLLIWPSRTFDLTCTTLCADLTEDVEAGDEYNSVDGVGTRHQSR